jgi:septal ring factor EnvC (AmiA/AmiB activator)
MKWMIIIWIFLGWSLYLITSDLWAAQAERVEKELSQKKEEFNRIKKELRLKQEEEKNILRKESSIRESFNEIQKDLHKRGKIIEQKRAGLGQIKRRIRDTENQIFILNRDVEQSGDKLNSGLQTLYKISQIPLEAYLFNLSSCSDLLKMDKYLRVLSGHRAKLMKTYKHELALKLRGEEKLSQNRIQWQRSISEEEKKKEKARKLRDAEQAKLKATVNQKIAYQKSITEMEKRGKLIQSLIDKLEREKRGLSYRKPKYGMLKGKLRLPVQGKVVSFFKERGQNGIEIETSIGAPVWAILRGKVVYADWFKGLGNLMIIDHGDGIFTISGKCSKLIKKCGDTVSEGEVIAWVGNSESDQVPPFYFEIRHRGKPQDPMEWIPSPKRGPRK